MRYLSKIPPLVNLSILIKFEAKPFDALPQFFFSLIFLAPSLRIEQSLLAPKTKGVIETTLPSSQVKSQTIAHSGSICNLLSPLGNSILHSSKGKTFKNAGIETAVLETGMGGRLDATNIVNPLISVITPIELEHTRILGNTIEQIATEKAGIIKRNRPVAVSFQSPKAEKIIREKAAEEDSTAYFIKDIVDEIIWNPSPSGMDLEIRWKDKKIFKRNIKTRLKLLGQVQGENAALAALSCKIAYPEITEETIEKGLSKAWIPSRFEIVNTNPPVILDGAHTPLSISFSLETLNSLWPDKKVNLLFACAQDKKVEEISRILCPRCSKIFITKPGNTKPCNPERMVKAFKESLLEKFSEDHQKVNETLDMDLDFVNSINRALKTSEKENRILLVTGSFYLTAEVKKIISG